MNLIICNACKALKLLNITWIHTCISFNRLIWLIQKNGKIDILSLLFMPFTGNKSPGAKKCSDEWWCDNFTNIFWVKRTFIRANEYCSSNLAVIFNIIRMKEPLERRFLQHYNESVVWTEILYSFTFSEKRGFPLKMTDFRWKKKR